MSKTIKEQIRVLVKEHERGLLPTDDYRRLRGALLQRAASGEVNAPPEPTATRPRPPAGAPPPPVDDVLDVLDEASPPDDAPRSDPTNRRTAAERAAAAAKSKQKPEAAPPPVKPDRQKSRLPLMLAAVVGIAIVLVLLLLRPAPDDAPSLSEVAPALRADEPAQQLAQDYLDASDWSPGSMRTLIRDWGDLPPASRHDIKSTGWYRELARELRDRLRLSSSSDLGDTSATTTALLQLADSLDVRVDERPVIVANEPEPAPAAVRLAQTEAPSPAPRTEGKKTVVKQPAQVIASPTPVEAATKLDEPAITAPVSEPPANVEPAATDVTQAAPEVPAAKVTGPGQCEERVGNTRSRFCRDELADGTAGPRYAIVRPGTFKMGSITTAQEQPVHTVTMTTAYAMAISEVSFAEFARFCAATGYTAPDNPWNDDTLPVVNVTWSEAQAYARWWSRETGHKYRLPSEAQWEFAARGGTTTTYPFGDEISAINAHFSDTKRMERPLPAEGRLIVGNKLGLKHIAGNAREWVQDTWQENYAGAPTDGSARAGDAALRVVRGGSYRDRSQALRSAARDKQAAASRDAQTGFRLVREISGQ